MRYQEIEHDGFTIRVAFDNSHQYDGDPAPNLGVYIVTDHEGTGRDIDIIVDGKRVHTKLDFGDEKPVAIPQGESASV